MLNLSDTAGIRDASDTIEKIGIERTQAEADKADLIIHVYNELPEIINENEITVINKSDLLKDKSNNPLAHFALQRDKNVIYTSVKNNTGFDELINAIKNKMHELMSGSESRIAINERTYELLNDAIFELDTAINKYDGNYDIFAEHIRRGGDSIGKILGTITTAEIADATFSRLCLGK